MNMELSDSDNPVHNLSKTGNVDSIKVRGNSTADVVSKNHIELSLTRKRRYLNCLLQKLGITCELLR